MPFLKNELRLNEAHGAHAVANNIRQSIESLGLECLVEKWPQATGDGPYELIITDLGGNTGDWTVVTGAHAEPLRSSDPGEIFRYIVTVLSNFSPNYHVSVKHPWGIEVDYLNSVAKLDLEPDPDVFLTASV